jgi:ATP-binding cassette subfamily F protein 3
VSHDRRFVSLLADQLWVARNGRVEVFSGTFEQWQESEEEAAKRREAATKTVRTPRPPRAARPPRPLAAETRPVPKAANVDHEKLIGELEARLRTLEQRLQGAAERNAFAELSSLSREHAEAQAALDQAWESWRASAGE